ncbi:MAG: DUF167 domain-containing protein [Burkholderiaceae bacterium]|nr:DUF167 domain-containing protein [Burkholderiaceae bacterium]
MTDLKHAVDKTSISLYCQPGASRTRVSGLHDGKLKIQLAAPPVEGAANEALIKFIARVCGVRHADVQILAGAQSRHKRIEVRGLSSAQIHDLLMLYHR